MSMNRSSPAKRTIASKRDATSRRGRPRMEALRKTLSRPDSSGWNPAPSSSRAETRPSTMMSPAVGVKIRVRSFRRVLFPEPLEPVMTKITVEERDRFEIDTPMLAVSMFDEDQFDESLVRLDEALGGALRRLKDSGEMSGKPRSVTVLHTPTLLGNDSSPLRAQ